MKFIALILLCLSTFANAGIQIVEFAIFNQSIDECIIENKGICFLDKHGKYVNQLNYTVKIDQKDQIRFRKQSYGLGKEHCFRVAMYESLSHYTNNENEYWPFDVCSSGGSRMCELKGDLPFGYNHTKIYRSVGSRSFSMSPNSFNFNKSFYFHIEAVSKIGTECQVGPAEIVSKGADVKVEQ